MVLKTAVAVGFVGLFRAQDHAMCPLNLIYEAKDDDHVFVFNSAGLHDLLHGSISDLFKCRNDDKSALLPYAIAPVVTKGASATSASGSKPISASLAGEIVKAQALANLCMQNVQQLEIYLPGDSVTYGTHAINMVLSNLEPNSPMLLSPYANPNVLEAVMGLSFGLHQHLKFPLPGSTKKETSVSFLWATSFGQNPNTKLSNKIIADSIEMNFRWFDLISQHMDAGAAGTMWYSAVTQGILKYYNKFTAKNFLAWSPAFNVAIAQEFFAQMEMLFKRPVPATRSKSALEREFVLLVSEIFNFEKLSMRYREWCSTFPAEAAAWIRQCASDPGVIEALPTFGGISMVHPTADAVGGPAPKKAKKEPATKEPKVLKPPKVVPKAGGGSGGGGTATVPGSVIPLPVVNTRGTALAQTVCRYHVKHLFLDMSECNVSGCTYHHQDDVKDFTKFAMLKWLALKLPGDSDYAKLKSAIESKAR